MRRPPSPRASALEVASDQLEARLTCPREPIGRRCRVGAAPASDVDLWTAHVAVHDRRDGDQRLRLVEHYRPQATRVARGLQRSGEALDDLEQVALEALLLAIDRFDPRRRLPFLGFANPTIRGSIKRHYRDLGWALRVPRRVHDLAAPLAEAREALAQDLGRPPTVSEVADMVGLPIDEVLSAEAAQHARATASIEAGSEESSPLSERIGGPDHGFARIEDRAALASALEHVDHDGRALLELYFTEGLSQQEIGNRLGVSQMQVSRRLTAVLNQLRSRMER